MKKIIFLLPVALLLTSCDVFKIGFVNEEHSAGIEGGASTSGQTYREDYSYFAGDAISTEGKSVANLTFNPDDGLSDISIEKVSLSDISLPISRIKNKSPLLFFANTIGAPKAMSLR